MGNTIQGITHYNSLSPVENADPDGHYSEALLWALQNREAKDIKNIAITGPYGSGKSSILKTFEKNNKDESLVFLNISLATFKEEKKKKETSDQDKDNEKGADHVALLRLIELSILQQIFYHEEDAAIPDTRFKKTRSFPERKVLQLAISISLFLIAVLHQLYPQLIEKTLRVTFAEWFEIGLHYLTLAGVVIGTFYFLWRSIRPLRGIQIKKFNFQDAEFSVDESISKSILNDHLDEILYFFEVTKYTVVVIEDLDRFEQTEIFTKLRELNLLINYSKKTKRKVSFIYAVRDDMFQDKDRTKFFDFIIPVIPVINSSNSNEILLDIVKKNKYPVKTDLIDDISLFVDDMRLLYNIMNEYYLYHKKLSGKLDQNKLLAIIVYKNIFPNDFVSLSNGEGELFQLLENKAKYIGDSIRKIDAQITELKNEIKVLESIGLKDVHELRKLYVLEYVSQNPKIVGFKINQVNYGITQVMEANIFQSFIDNKAEYRHVNGADHGYTIHTEFAAIEKAVDPKMTYAKRLKLLMDLEQGKIEEIKADIADHEIEKDTVRHSSMKNLMAEDLIEINFENKRQQQLVSILLRAGYIDENYLDYVSIFYEGSISKADKEFLLNVKAHIRTDFDFGLSKIDKLITKIPPVEFEQHYILNYSLLDYLLSTNGNSGQRLKIMTTLSNETETSSVTFINGFIDKSEHVPKFIKSLAKVWPGMWKYISTKSNFTSARIEEYFRLIIEHAEIADINAIAEQSDFADHITEYEDFLIVSENQDKLKKIISTLNIKFKNLRFENAPSSLLDFVYEGKFYKANSYMLQSWMELKGVYEEDTFNTQNYSSFNNQHKELKVLIDYVDENLDQYMNEIWMPLPSDQNEEAGYLSFLLNSDKLSVDAKAKVLQKNTSKIDDIGEIYQVDVLQMVMTANKLEPTWTNVLGYFSICELTIDAHLLQFLNHPQNASELTEAEFTYSDGDDGITAAQKFFEELVLKNEMNNELYRELTSRMPWSFERGLDLKDLQAEKVKILIQLKKLNLSPENYEMLRTHHRYLHIELLEIAPEKIITDLAKYQMDEDDICAILASEQFSSVEKNIIAHQLDDQTIIANDEILQLLGPLAIYNSGITMSKEVLIAVLKAKITGDNRMILLIKEIKTLNKDEFFDIMRSWSEPFSKIKPDGKQVVVPATSRMSQFTDILHFYNFTYKPKPDKKGIRIYNLRN